MTLATLSDRLTRARTTVEATGQAHVLRFVDQLAPDQADRLLTQVEAIDWPQLERLIRSHVLDKPVFELPSDIQPARSYPHSPPADLVGKYHRARDLGEQLIRAGKVAAFTVAGGQGSRLGWDAPKGTFPATPISKQPLFGVLAQYLLKVQQKYSVACPWYIMTSPGNDAATRDFFQQNAYFGLSPDDVMFFPQGMMPAIGLTPPYTGKVLLETPDSLALSPNGHGGSLQAIYTSAAYQDMQQRGIEQISYTQIDNPVVRVIDPLFIGLHALDDCQMSSKMVPKAYPEEKLGVFCAVDSRTTVIEYSDLPADLAQQRLPAADNSREGPLRFRAGSIAIHVIRLDFVASLNQAPSGFALPLHRAEKKVAHTDPESSQTITPDTPNAVKLETFVFDALPLCRHSVVYETSRGEEFAPIKNAQGVDSPQTSQQLQIDRAGRWLESKGVQVPRDAQGHVDAVIEISPLTAIEPDDLNADELPPAIAPSSELQL